MLHLRWSFQRLVSSIPCERLNAQDRNKATNAPTPEQTALTASLSNPTRPPAWRVGVPQLCTSLSVAVAHGSHQRRDWSVAPRSESAIAPATPPSATAVNGTGQLASAATAPMNSAPQTPAAEPTSVIPPEVPGGTLLPEIIEIGSPPSSVPTSAPSCWARPRPRQPRSARSRR